MDERTERLLAAVDRLAPAFEASGLDELELDVGDLGVRLARPTAIAPLPAPAAADPAPGGSVQPSAPTPSDDGYASPESGRHHVTAPLTGVWYDAPSPGARPYVGERSEVAAGQVIGLIEAMKLFNEIKADASGTITRVLVESGTLVKRRQPLVEIDPN
ncbi:MAG: acetyl-CoA carboxylase biotin carboxyl carrier protein [Chloroflexi bacterium]|nr:acetyl-CoA carboxylase biotin carboxyl carrier protein [Chloroflexota bacterium]